MKFQTSTVTGCGNANCECAGTPAPSAQVVINGMVVGDVGQNGDPDSLRELAHAELLRQEAVRQGLLPRCGGSVAPTLGERERRVIEDMVDQAVLTPQPDEEACMRYYEANKDLFVRGQALHVRHILFAVTPGVDVHALTVHAERALLELSRKEVPPERFAQLAASLSNCPSGTQGGDLGWIGPDDCAPELANELFHQKHSRWGMGVHPRLIHTRFGFHIIEVLGRRKGRQLSFADVHQRIAADLALRTRARALHQYMAQLARQAMVEGIDLTGADSPLVQ